MTEENDLMMVGGYESIEFEEYLEAGLVIDMNTGFLNQFFLEMKIMTSSVLMSQLSYIR